MEELRRELGVVGATMLGLGSILGTGVFVSIGLVSGLAGAWTPLAVLTAAFVATCNALSSAQLASAHPVSGGTYEYGYRLLHPLAGFTAGWMFLCAKSASAATAALGLAGYLLDLLDFGAPWGIVPVAAVVVVLFTILVASGLRRSNQVNTVIVSITILALLAFVAAGSSRAMAGWRSISWSGTSWPGFLEATALMFVAYTGYGRVATLGEEVHDPRSTIPRAIVATLAVSAVLYLLVALVGIGAVGGDGLLAATEGGAAPLETAARGFGIDGVPLIVALGAVTAMAGVLLNLLLGLSRVLLAMGRRKDMPQVVGRVRAGSPAVAVLVVGTIILGLTLMGSIRLAWSFSAFTVLVYYALTNLAALRLRGTDRLYARWWSWAGLAGCAGLAFWVEPRIWIAGLCVLVSGWSWHAVARSKLRVSGSGR